MVLSSAGNLSLPLGTLTVARDPASAMDVATMGWVGRSTVSSFNGRRGVVTLRPSDIECLLGYSLCEIMTPQSTNAAICSAIQDLIHTYQAVW